MSKLQTYRKEKALSQKELADISGVTLKMIREYEQGQRNINGAAADRLYRLALALGCRIEDLLENREEIEMESLKKLYAEWRRQADEHNAWEDECGGSNPVYWDTDCGEPTVREDFSNWANLEEVISFEDMMELERGYEG